MSGAPRERDRSLLNPRRRDRARRRAGVIGLFLIGVVVVGAVVITSLHLHPFGRGASTTTTTTGASGPTGPTAAPKPGPQVAVSRVAALLAPASRVAVAPFGTDGVLFLGGYDAAGTALDTIQSLSGASVQAAGTLPAGEGSAVAASLGTGIYLFGGLGSTIFQITATGDDRRRLAPGRHRGRRGRRGRRHGLRDRRVQRQRRAQHDRRVHPRQRPHRGRHAAGHAAPRDRDRAATARST